MKPTLHLLAALLLIAIGDVHSQESDSTTTTTSNEIIDPAQNRLFMMSTGRTMPANKFSLADFTIVLLQGGYAPTDFLHFNLTTFIPTGEPVYWSVGTKVQVVKPDGGFQGFCIGADVGFFDELFKVSSSYNSQVLSLNAAVSAGNEGAKVHANLAYIIPLSGRSISSYFPTYMQIGTDIRLRGDTSGGGLKFLAEMLLPFSNRGISGTIILAGLRISGRTVVGDIGWPLAVGAGGAGFSPIPFFSLSVVF
jgi:hypothetical protein